MGVIATVEWDATAVVLVIAALGGMFVQVITAWKTNRIAEATHAKVEVIETHTNGMNAALEATRKELAIELATLKAANLAALIEQRDRAQAKVVEQQTEITRRADAAAPPGPKDPSHAAD